MIYSVWNHPEKFPTGENVLKLLLTSLLICKIGCLIFKGHSILHSKKPNNSLPRIYSNSNQVFFKNKFVKINLSLDKFIYCNNYYYVRKCILLANK